MFEWLSPKESQSYVAPAFDQTLQGQRKLSREATQAHADETGILDGIYAANRSGLTGAVGRFFQQVGYVPDPEFRVTPEHENSWRNKGISPEQYSLFAKAVSAEHLDWLEHLALENQEDAAVMSEFGLASHLALGMTDVVGLGIDVASGGLGYAAKAGRLANAMRSGVLGATSTGAMMGAVSAYNPEITLADGVTAAALSFALSAPLGARKGHLYQDNINPDTVKRAAGLNDAESLSAAKADDVGVTQDPAPGADPLREPFESEMAFEKRALINKDVTPHFAEVRRDLASRMGSAKSHIVREAGRVLFRDGVGYTDRNIAVEESAGELAKRHLATLETQWRRGFNVAWDEHKQAAGVRWYNMAARRQFSEEVGRAVRGDINVSPQAQKAADAVRDAMSSALKLAKESKLDGFVELPDSPNYLPRYWKPEGFRKLFGEYNLQEEDVIEQLVKPSMRKAWEDVAKKATARQTARMGKKGQNLGKALTPEIDEVLLDAVARSYIKRAQANFEGDGFNLLFKPLATDAADELDRVMLEYGVSTVKWAEIKMKFQRAITEARKVDRGKHRIDLDENFSTVIRSQKEVFDGHHPDNPTSPKTRVEVTEHRISMSDLFDNDVESVMSRYLRDITGWAALARKAGIHNQDELDIFLNQVKVDARKAGDDVKDIERMLEIGVNSTFGRSTEKDSMSKASRYGRLIRNWNFSRVMNQVGFTMFAELGPVIAHSGLRNVLKSIPEIPKMLKRGADGTLESKEAHVMEQLFAPGTDLIRNPPFLRLDDGDMVGATFQNAPWVDNAINMANHVTNIMSGMAPITSILQRLAGRGTLLRMMDMAKMKTLKPADVARLRTWGLDEAAQYNVFEYLKTVKKIEDINPRALPMKLREQLSAFMYRATRHQVLEGDASDSIELMHGVTGRLVLQFRTFMFNSYTRHFLNSIHHLDDWRTYQMFMLSTAFAGMGWAARAYLNTAHDKDMRERLLTTENFIKNAVAQSSWAAFGPALVDTVWADVLGNDPVFQGNRSTGLQNGVMGIPALDLLNKVYGAAGITGSLLDADEHVTEQQMQDFWRIWMFSNMTGVRNIVDAGLDTFPDRPDGTNRPPWKAPK